MNDFENDGLAFVTLSLSLLVVSFYESWLGADMNIWLWIAGLGLVGFMVSLIYFFVPNISCKRFDDAT